MTAFLTTILFLMAMVAFLIGLNLVRTKAKITTDLVTMMAMIANKLLGAIYTIGALIVFALLLR